MAFDTVANICGKDSSLSQPIREVVPVKQNNVVEVAGHKVGDGYPPFIIAEAGMNHNGSLDLAFKLIDEAKPFLDDVSNNKHKDHDTAFKNSAASMFFDEEIEQQVEGEFDEVMEQALDDLVEEL